MSPASPLSGRARRILIHAPLLGAGGRETHLLHLCRELRSHGAEVTLVSRVVNPDTPLVQQREQLGVRLVSTPFAGSEANMRKSSAWAAAFWHLQLPLGYFDVLCSIESTPIVRFLKRFVRSDGQILCHRAGIQPPPGSYLDPSVKALLDGFIVETPLQAAAAREVFELKVPVPSIPLLHHTCTAPQPGARKPGPLHAAYLGRFDVKKGVHRLVDLWPHVQPPDARLTFFGHGPCADSLRQAIGERGLGSRVQVGRGWTAPDELSALLADVDMVLLPSDEEGLPLVLMESLANGIPFVASDVGAIRWLTNENPQVAVVPLDNALIVRAITDLGARVLAGEIDRRKLQDYHERYYGYDHLAQLWTAMFLDTERALVSDDAFSGSLASTAG